MVNLIAASTAHEIATFSVIGNVILLLALVSARSARRREGEERQAELAAVRDNDRDKAKARKLLLDHARRRELTDGALRRALREATESEHRPADEWDTRWDSEWKEFFDDPDMLLLTDELLWELVVRELFRQRPSSLEEAEGQLRGIAAEFGLDERVYSDGKSYADAANGWLRKSWPDDIEDEYDRIELGDYRFGSAEELEEEHRKFEQEYLRSIERRGATSPRAVMDLQSEISRRFSFGSARAESLEQLKEVAHARAKELGFGPGDVKALDAWLRSIGHTMVAPQAPRPPAT
jgi:hypothetical protein